MMWSLSKCGLAFLGFLSPIFLYKAFPLTYFKNDNKENQHGVILFTTLPIRNLVTNALVLERFFYNTRYLV